jgi:hypothetical protein
VITSSIIDVFKWRDWTMSLGLNYRPILLGTSTRSERFHYERITRELRADGLRPPADIAPDATVDELMEDFHARCRVEDADGCRLSLPPTRWSEHGEAVSVAARRPNHCRRRARACRRIEIPVFPKRRRTVPKQA